MIDYSKHPRHNVLCVDMKSFFATCECVERGYDPLTKKLAVVGNKEQDGSVVLASSPALKKLGIKTSSRLYEIKELKDPSIFIAQARMGLYQKKSEIIRDIFKEYVPENQLDVYSIDEAWLTLNGTESLWGDSWQTAECIKNDIQKRTGIIATIGIGDNKLLAKVVLDNYGKNEGIAECRYEDVEKLLHPLLVEDLWGVGTQMKKHFQHMKIYTIGDLAKAPIETLKKNFGVNGVHLRDKANGIDNSPVIYENEKTSSAFTNNDQNAKSIGRGVTLWEDYKRKENIVLVISELLEDVCEVLRKRRKMGKTVHLSVEYSKEEGRKGFSRQKTTQALTNDHSELLEVAKSLFEEHYEDRKPVRKIRVAVGNLSEEEEQEENEKSCNKKIMNAQDLLNEKFGKGTIRKASSLLEKSISKEQKKKIRGHYE